MGLGICSLTDLQVMLKPSKCWEPVVEPAQLNRSLGCEWVTGELEIITSLFLRVVVQALGSYVSWG